MEYEIPDETRLFDESTNPSLLQAEWAPPRRPGRRHVDRADREGRQTAEVIPEEEHQPG